MKAENWAFQILNEELKKGIAKKDFYKLFMYPQELCKLYNVPDSIQLEVIELILQALKRLSND